MFTFWLFEDGDVPLTVFFVWTMHQALGPPFPSLGNGHGFAFRRRDLKTFLNERVVRLGVPLLFATYILLGGLIAPVETLWLMLVPFPGADAMPHAHLWFLRNPLLYSVLLAPLLPTFEPTQMPARSRRTLDRSGRWRFGPRPSPHRSSARQPSSPNRGIRRSRCGGSFSLLPVHVVCHLAIQTGAMWFERIEALRWWLLATTLPLSLVCFSSNTTARRD